MMKAKRTMMIAGLVAACGLAAAPLSTQAQAPRDGAGDAGGAERTNQSRRTVDPRLRSLVRMMRPITISFEGAQLRDVLEFFSDTAGVEFDVKWINEKMINGLDPEMEISAEIDNKIALDALEVVLEKASDDEFDEAIWQFGRDGVLELGPRSRLNRGAFVKTYYVQDLLMRVPDFENAPELDVDSVLGGGEGGGQSPFDDEDDEEDEDLLGDRELALEELVDLIQLAVEPEQWRANGGDGGAITMFQQTMVIRAPDYMHRQINGYEWLPGDFGGFVQRYRDRLRREDGGVQRYGPGAGGESGESGSEHAERDSHELSPSERADDDRGER